MERHTHLSFVSFLRIEQDEADSPVLLRPLPRSWYVTHPSSLLPSFPPSFLIPSLPFHTQTGIPPSLAPAALELPFDDVTILRIGDR